MKRRGPSMSEHFSRTISEFQGRPVPERVRTAGYAALIDHYRLKLPLPPRLAAIGERHRPTSTNEWQVLTPRHAPEDSLLGHLEFALKWEGVDLAVLAALFQVVDDKQIKVLIRSAPTGAYTRRLWYLHEWLTARQLDIPDPGKVRAVPVVDPEQQFSITDGTPSARHKVIDNMPGTRAFCPMVRRPFLLQHFPAKNLHDRRTRETIPEHISARPEDLKRLVEGIVAFDQRAVRGGIDPVVVAASIAFGFVYVHPFEDGNGRLHRWLIHHALANAGYNPAGLVFPVSAAILRQIEKYQTVLESYSRPLLDFIDWKAMPGGNVQVKTEPANNYRYFDATAHAEFLYTCVQETIEHDLPDEVAYLQAYDRFSQGAQAILDRRNT